MQAAVAQEFSRVEIPKPVLYMGDAWECINDGHVWTLREDSEEETLQRFPAKPHIWHVIRLMQGRHPEAVQRGWDHRFLFIKKSRRMLMTWAVCWYILHDTMTNPGVTNGIGSVRMDSVEWMLSRRFKLMYDQLPDDIFPAGKPRMAFTKGHIGFPDMGSELIGFPHGSEKYRGYTFRIVGLDEVAHWDTTAPFIDTYFGLRPAARQIVAFSSPEEGSGFKRMCLAEEL